MIRHTLTESTQHISDSLNAPHPEVEWREIAQFRNVVVHDYLGIDPARVRTSYSMICLNSSASHLGPQRVWHMRGQPHCARAIQQRSWGCTALQGRGLYRSVWLRTRRLQIRNSAEGTRDPPQAVSAAQGWVFCCLAAMLREATISLRP
ncbi:MAG: DUF86 domain-containing protein [Anaerolineae bacterium]